MSWLIVLRRCLTESRQSCMLVYMDNDYDTDDTDYDMYDASYEDYGMEDYEPSPYDGTYSEE